MKHKYFLFLTISLICACSGNETDVPNDESASSVNLPINLNVEMTSTRATDENFEIGDTIGLYVVNYSDGAKSKILSSGNQVNNEKFTFDGENWKSSEPLYWKDETTHADFYCYYPYIGVIDNVNQYKFYVNTNQKSKQAYKACDLLWGKRENVAPTSTPVSITTSHAMSRICIFLEAGNGYTAETLASANKELRITNLKTEAIVDFNKWTVTAAGSATDIAPYEENGVYKALIVPQQLNDDKLITLTIDGYTYSLVQTIAFVSNKQYNCTLKINKTSEGINVGISPWDTENVDYGGTLN